MRSAEGPSRAIRKDLRPRKGRVVGEGRVYAMAQPVAASPRSTSAGGVLIEDPRDHVECVGDALPLGARDAIEQRAERRGSLGGHRLRGAFALLGEAHVGLATVLRAAPPDDIGAPLEAGEIATGGRRG